MKYIIKISFLFIAISSFAQAGNILLDRTFWKKDPSVQIVKQMVAKGNSATEFNANGFDATTLSLIANVDTEVVNYLLSLEGNPVDKRTHDSRIYLHWAGYGGNVENVKTLLALESDVTAKDSRGNTPLIFSAGAGLTNPEIYNLFAEQGVKLTSEKNQQGANLLLLAAPFLKNEKELNYFIDQGFTLTDIDNDGNGIFNYASRRGNIELMKLLAEKGVQYKTENKNGANAFMFAAQGTRGFNNSIEVYQYLKSLGLKSNVVTQDGSTPLHRIANSKVDKEIFEFFIKSGSNVDQKDADGNTPFLNASARNSLDIIKLLAEHSKQLMGVNKKDQTALMLAVAKNSPDVVEFLLKKGLKTEAKDKDGNTLAYYLVESFNSKKSTEFEEKLKMLQETGLKLNTLQAGGNTFFHFAAKADDLELLKRLSNFDIPVNAVNKEGMTALQQAAMKAKDDQFMKYLISLGADTSSTTEFGETAYDLASENEILQANNVELNFLN